MNDQPAPARIGRLALALVFVAAGAVVAVVMVVAGVFDGDDGPGPVTDDAPAVDAELPSEVTTFEITAPASGETFTTTLHPAPTNVDRLLVAAPSRNADEASLTPLIDELLRRDCASVVTFDARLLERTTPLDAYIAVVGATHGVIGFVGPDIAMLGASFTGLPALQAAETGAAGYAFVMSPSQESPSAPPDGVMTLLIGAARDGGFVDIYHQWADLGYEAVEFDSDRHGTAMFENGVGADVIAEIADRFCA